MERKQLKFAVRGAANPAILSLPGGMVVGSVEDDLVEVFCIPLAHRKGGILLAIPHSIISDEVLQAGNSAESNDDLVGPSKMMSSKLEVQEADGSINYLEDICGFLVIDFTNEVLNHMQPYDPVFEDYQHVIPFFETIPNAFPSMAGIGDKIREWTAEAEAPRAVFYSAREEPEGGGKAATAAKKAAARRVTNVSLMEEVEGLKAQLALLKAQAAPAPLAGPAIPAEEALGGARVIAPKLPGLSQGLLGNPTGVAKVAALLGPPPKTRAPIPGKPMVESMQEDEPQFGAAVDQQFAGQSADQILLALAQQSSAITSLVAHLAGGADPMSDLSASSSSQAAGSTRGVQRRDRMMQELAAGKSNFFLQVQQQLCRKLNPASPAPSTEEELSACDASVLLYLERFGGYQRSKELGLVMWLLGHIADAFARGDPRLAREHTALALCAVEQAALDKGDWSLGFMLGLTSEPPVQMFQDRLQNVAAYGRSFGPLTPSGWAATSLAFLKEMEVLQSRKSEVRKPKADPPVKDPDADSPSPKRRPRYPKKPKPDGDA